MEGYGRKSRRQRLAMRMSCHRLLGMLQEHKGGVKTLEVVSTFGVVTRLSAWEWVNGGPGKSKRAKNRDKRVRCEWQCPIDRTKR